MQHINILFKTKALANAELRVLDKWYYNKEDRAVIKVGDTCYETDVISSRETRCPELTMIRLSWSPSGRKIVVTRDLVIILEKYSIAIYDRNLSQISQIGGTYRNVAAGGNILAATRDKYIELWDISDPHNPKPITYLNEAPWIIALSQDGKLLASDAGSAVYLRDISDPNNPKLVEVYDKSLHGEVTCIAFSPDNKLLASSHDDDGIVALWDISNLDEPKLIRKLPTSGDLARAVAFSPDGKLLAAGSNDKVLNILYGDYEGKIDLRDVSDPNNPKFRWRFSHTVSIIRITFSPDGKLLAYGAVYGSVGLWDLSNLDDPKHKRSAKKRELHTYSIAFLPDGKTIAASFEDHVVLLWDISDLDNPKPVKWSSHGGYVYSIAFSPDGKLLASGSKDGMTGLWDISDPKFPKLIKWLEGHEYPVCGVSFSPDGKLLASYSCIRNELLRLGKKLGLRDVSDPYNPKPLTWLGSDTDDDAGITSFSFSPDGKLLAYGSSGEIYLCDISDPSNPKLINKYKAHDDYITSIAFSPDGKLLASGSDDGRLGLRDVSDPHNPRLIERLANTKSIMAVSFSPDGKLLAAGTYEYYGFRDVSDPNSPKLIGWFSQESGMERGYIQDFSFSPDGKLFAYVVGKEDAFILISDFNTNIITIVGEHREYVRSFYSVEFSPDGKLLALAGDSTFLLYSLTPLPDADIKFGYEGVIIKIGNVTYLFSPIKNVRAYYMYRLELKPSKSDMSYSDRLSLALSLFKQFKSAPVKTLKIASEKGVLKELIDILLNEGLIERFSSAYISLIEPETTDGLELLEEGLAGILLDDIRAGNYSAMYYLRRLDTKEKGRYIEEAEKIILNHALEEFKKQYEKELERLKKEFEQKKKDIKMKLLRILGDKYGKYIDIERIEEKIDSL